MTGQCAFLNLITAIPAILPGSTSTNLQYLPEITLSVLSDVMVASTRTQTGTIEISRYDPITLQLKCESQPFTSTRRTSSTKPPDRKKPGVRKTGGRKLGRGHDRSSSWSDEKKLESLVRNLKLKEPTTQAFNGLDDDSTTFWPPVAFGEYEEEGLWWVPYTYLLGC